MNRDKILHHAAGFAICLGIILACTLAGMPTLPSIACGWLVTQGVATSKEAFDEARPDAHTVDWLDSAATTAGAHYAAGLAMFLALVVFRR